MKFDIELVKKSKIDDVDFDNLVFGAVPSDHMLVADYTDGQWTNVKIMPYQALSFQPNLSALHYGQSIFEGLKAYHLENGEVKIFRVRDHSKRLNISAERLCMPAVPEDLFVEGIHKLVSLDKDWIPKKEGSSLYIRPIMFATDESLGVVASKTYKLVIFTTPVSSYYAGTVNVKVETDFVRASEGGTGFIKAAGNYSASLLPAKKALEEGYQQLLWTDAKEHKYIEEAGTMNVMFQIGDTIVTPALSTSILSGVTRRSVIEYAKHLGYPVEERRISLDELMEAHENGTLKDAFGTGTAVTIHHINSIRYKDTVMTLPPEEQRGFSNQAKQFLHDLKLGRQEDIFNWMDTVEVVPA